MQLAWREKRRRLSAADRVLYLPRHCRADRDRLQIRERPQSSGTVTSMQRIFGNGNLYTPCPRGVRFTPESRHSQCKLECLLRATSRQCAYSITSSAVKSNLSGMLKPSVFAVFKLMVNTNLVGACTGRSPGFAPLRMRSTYLAAPRN
jgi:hypothetical protein